MHAVSATIVRLDDFRTGKREEQALPKPPVDPRPITAAEAIEICLRHRDRITVWEERFLVSIRRFPRLSVKQHAVLQRIFEKVSLMAEGQTP